jgi:predicted nucleotidyltransferase
MKPISENLSRVLANHRVEIAYLFGSQARGEAGPLSDADIAVLFEEGADAQTRFRAKVMLTSELPSLLGSTRVDVVDLAEAPPALAFQIIKDGKVIWNIHEDRRVEFESRTMVRYYDTAHMRRQLQDAILNHFLEKRRC